MSAPTDLVKFTNERCCHHGLAFKEGENTALEPWNTEQCSAGGIYSAVMSDRNWTHWMTFQYHKYVWDCQVAPGSPWQIEREGKVKAHRVILTNRRPICDWLMTLPDGQFLQGTALMMGDLSVAAQWRLFQLDRELMLTCAVINTEVQHKIVSAKLLDICLIMDPDDSVINLACTEFGCVDRKELHDLLTRSGANPLWGPDRIWWTTKSYDF